MTPIQDYLVLRIRQHLDIPSVNTQDSLARFVSALSPTSLSV